MLELVFDPIQCPAESHRGKTAHHAEQDVVQQTRRNAEIHAAHLEHRIPPHHHKPRGRRQRAGDHERNEGTRSKFKQQQFNRQYHSGDRRVECRRHSRPGAACQQHFALNGRHLEQLADQRADRPSRLNNRPFRAERPARADGHRHRKRLENGDLRMNPAAARQHRFHRLGNAVSLDLRRAVLGHQPDHKPACRRQQNYPQAEMVPCRARERGGEPAKEEQVGKQADQLEQQIRDKPRANADAASQHRNQSEPEIRAVTCRHFDVPIRIQ